MWKRHFQQLKSFNTHSIAKFFEKKIRFFFQNNTTLYQEEIKKLGKIFKTAFYVSRGNFLRKPFFAKLMFLYLFSDFEQKSFRLLAKKFRQGFQNCISRVQTNILGFSKIFLKRERNWPTLLRVNAIGKHLKKRRI